MDGNSFAENRERIHPIRKGFLLLVTACAVYLVWWFVNYYPDSPYSDFVGKPVGLTIWFAMFAIVLVICLVALRMIVSGLRSLTVDRTFLNVKNVMIACIVASIVLPLLISLFLYIIYKMTPAYVRFVLGVVPILLFAVDMAWMANKMQNPDASQEDVL